MVPQSPVPRAPFNKLYPFRYAASGILLNRNDEYVRGAVERYGEFSEAEVDLFRDVLTPASHVLEIGGNMGAHTLALASLAAQVYTVEPQRFMFQTLCANVALNSLDNVVAWCAAVGCQPGIIKVPTLDPYTAQNFGCFSLRDEWSGGANTPVIVIDDLTFPRLDLIKLDCEGSELPALLGGIETIQQHRPWIYLEFAENRAELLQFFTSIGYFCCRHIPLHNREPNYLERPLAAGEDTMLGSDMVLACPEGRPPLPTMLPPFGQRHWFFLADDEDVLGRLGLQRKGVEPYGALARPA